jgi:response regulator of citrate/malate metabolism
MPLLGRICWHRPVVKTLVSGVYMDIDPEKYKKLKEALDTYVAKADALLGQQQKLWQQAPATTEVADACEYTREHLAWGKALLLKEIMKIIENEQSEKFQIMLKS